MERLPSTKLLEEILDSYSKDLEGLLGVAICDRNGFIIASKSI
ncbi:MAG: hypothetical protein ACFFEY_11510 [Candidatus Thorarchaeota archaeon]